MPTVPPVDALGPLTTYDTAPERVQHRTGTCSELSASKTVRTRRWPSPFDLSEQMAWTSTRPLRPGQIRLCERCLLWPLTLAITATVGAPDDYQPPARSSPKAKYDLTRAGVFLVVTTVPVNQCHLPAANLPARQERLRSLAAHCGWEPPLLLPNQHPWDRSSVRVGPRGFEDQHVAVGWGHFHSTVLLLESDLWALPMPSAGSQLVARLWLQANTPSAAEVHRRRRGPLSLDPVPDDETLQASWVEIADTVGAIHAPALTDPQRPVGG